MIEIQFIKTAPQEPLCFCIPFYDKEFPSEIPKVALEALERKPYQLCVEVFLQQAASVNRFLLLRLGSREKKSRKKLEEAGNLLFKRVSEGVEKQIVIDLRYLPDELPLIVGLLVAAWRLTRYITQIPSEHVPHLEQILILTDQPDVMQSQFKRWQAVVTAVNYARQLTSEPSNLFYPTAYAEKLQELTALGVEVEVLHEQQLRALGMEALVAIAQGSIHPPCIAVLRWQGLATSSPPIALVGKGVCFDAGGLCLKPAKDLPEMQYDSAGASVVAAVLQAVALQKFPIHVVGIIGLIENMPDGKAVKPGDVLKTASGQTVEIINTDAEGRLVLAECLWYAQKRFQPKVTIDLGTLTPETFFTLGSAYAGLYANDQELVQQLRSAGEKSGDWVWELPMGDYFAKQIESSIADIKNLGTEYSGENGAAAEFLQRFVTSQPWAHLDIAGVSWILDGSQFRITGYGVRLLEEWLHQRVALTLTPNATL